MSARIPAGHARPEQRARRTFDSCRRTPLAARTGVCSRDKGRTPAHGDPEGHQALRSALAAMLASTRGLAVTADDVFVTRGSQMALALVARALLRPGDIVAVERIGYRARKRFERPERLSCWPRWTATASTSTRSGHSRDAAGARGLRHAASPVSDDRDVEGGQASCASLARAHRAIRDRRGRLRSRVPLRRASGATAGQRRSGGVVVYVGTLSKILAPSIRIGYIVALPAVVESVGAIRSLLDIQGDLATEAAVAELIEDGELQRHVARVRRVYANRREILADRLRRAFGDPSMSRCLEGAWRCGFTCARRGSSRRGVGEASSTGVLVSGAPLCVRRATPALCTIQLCQPERA